MRESGRGVRKVIYIVTQVFGRVCRAFGVPKDDDTKPLFQNIYMHVWRKLVKVKSASRLKLLIDILGTSPLLFLSTTTTTTSSF